MVDSSMKCLQRHAGKRLAKDIACHREPVRPERASPSHRVFPEPRLRFVHPERDGFPHGRAVVPWIEPLLVEAVTDLVEDAEKRVAKVVFIEPRCDPAVTGPNSRAERMSGHVESAAVEVKSYCRSNRLTKYTLPLAGVKRLRIASPCLFEDTST